jgi:hypothetical protein
LDKEDQEETTKANKLANQLPHVTEKTNTMVSGMSKAAELVDTAHKDQDTSSEPTDQDVTDSRSHVTASQDSMKTYGTVLDAHLDKETQVTKLLANHLPHVTLISNIMVSMILKTVVHADTAHKETDGLSELTDPDVTDQEEHAHVPRDSTNKSGTVSNAQEANSETTGITITISTEELLTSTSVLTHHNATQPLPSLDQEKLATPVLYAQLDKDQIQFKTSAETSQSADVPSKSQLMDGHVSHAHHSMLLLLTEDNASQLPVTKPTQSSVMPLPATDANHAQLTGSQMPCRENVSDQDQLAHAHRSITHKTHTNVFNAQPTRLLPMPTLNVLMLPVPLTTSTLVPHQSAISATNAHQDFTQTHKEELATDSLPLLAHADRDSTKTVTLVLTAQLVLTHLMTTELVCQ